MLALQDYSQHYAFVHQDNVNISCLNWKLRMIGYIARAVSDKTIEIKPRESKEVITEYDIERIKFWIDDMYYPGFGMSIWFVGRRIIITRL